MTDPFGDRRDPLVKAMDRASQQQASDEIERLKVALKEADARHAEDQTALAQAQRRNEQHAIAYHEVATDNARLEAELKDVKRKLAEADAVLSGARESGVVFAFPRVDGFIAAPCWKWLHEAEDRARLAALGLVVTTREPTGAQLKAAMKVIDGRDPLEAVGYNLMRAAYYAMLEAAPDLTSDRDKPYGE